MGVTSVPKSCASTWPVKITNNVSVCLEQFALTLAKGLVVELASPYAQNAWGSKGERVRAAGLAACCNYFSTKKFALALSLSNSSFMPSPTNSLPLTSLHCVSTFTHLLAANNHHYPFQSKTLAHIYTQSQSTLLFAEISLGLSLSSHSLTLLFRR